MFSQIHGTTWQREEPVNKAKPFDIPKREVWEAFKHAEGQPTLTRIDAFVIRWARRKFKRLRHRTRGARDWFVRLRRATPTLFAHWQLCYGNGRTSGAV